MRGWFDRRLGLDEYVVVWLRNPHVFDDGSDQSELMGTVVDVGDSGVVIREPERRRAPEDPLDESSPTPEREAALAWDNIASYEDDVPLDP